MLFQLSLLLRSSRGMLFQLSLLLPSFRDIRGPNSDPAVSFGFAEFDPTVPFGLLVLPILIFPFAHAERSWLWILLKLSPHVVGARKEAGNFR